MSNKLRFLKWARDARIPESCLKTYRIYDYKPGQVRYQFGHYPTRNPYYPTEEDWKLLDLYAENGIEVIQIWEWSDICGFFGKGPMEPINEKGLRRFIEECHRRNLKVIPYVSPGYLDVRNPIYRPEWSRGAGHLVEVYHDLDMLCPGSPGWRAYFFTTINRLMDDYGFDGVYWDGGLGLSRPGCSNPNHDHHIHFVEISPQEKGELTHLDDAVKNKINEDFCALWNDFLSEMYARIKKRNGLVVGHIGSDIPSPFQDKCWDYQLLGEGIGNVLASIEKTKDYKPYIVRFNDWSRLITNWKKKDLTPNLKLVPEVEHLSMAGSIPYLQFPWLEGGCYGEEEDVFSIPGIPWKKEWDHWTEWIKAQRKAGLSPLIAASFAGNRDRYFKYLDIYKKMTRANTVVYIEVKAMDRNRFPVTEGNRRVSVFVNDFLWVAIGHLGTEPQEVLVQLLKGNNKGKIILLSPKTLTILRYYGLVSQPEVLQLATE